ncbi:GM17482 [Drosophila sechellia]|uniref:GM17482 n=1 Tax=Drosophila sechellia TaxID=7238 RepID=B4IHJ2_DROSE|nr:GM17482 [Drosophila sechellia]
MLLAVVRLEVFAEEVTTAASLSEEWGSGWRGTNFLVEVEQTAPISPPSSSSASSNGSEDYLGELGSQEVDDGFTTGATTGASNATTVETGPKIIVRTEEVLIVGLVLVLWVGAIMLFFNRWGKIRMLEPYQPKFQQQHRSSCPLVDLDAVTTHQRSSVSRMSMGMVHNLNMPTCQFAAYNPNIYAKANPNAIKIEHPSSSKCPQLVLHSFVRRQEPHSSKCMQFEEISAGRESSGN